MKIEQIVGAKILDVKIDSAKECLQLCTDKGDFNFIAVGDCCSKSWFEHINGIDRVLTGVVTELPKLKPDSIDSRRVVKDRYRNVVTETYITTIKTDKGSIDIEFRNESNGFYSGWLELDGDQYGDPIILPTLTSIREEF